MAARVSDSLGGAAGGNNRPPSGLIGNSVKIPTRDAHRHNINALSRLGALCEQSGQDGLHRARQAYLAEHRELIADARATVEQWTLDGFFGKRAQRELRANLTTDAQSPTQPNSMASAVQMSDAK